MSKTPPVILVAVLSYLEDVCSDEISRVFRPLLVTALGFQQYPGDEGFASAFTSLGLPMPFFFREWQIFPFPPTALRLHLFDNFTRPGCRPQAPMVLF